jgi:hypothetical protein
MASNLFFHLWLNHPNLGTSLRLPVKKNKTKLPPVCYIGSSPLCYSFWIQLPVEYDVPCPRLTNLTQAGASTAVRTGDNSTKFLAHVRRQAQLFHAYADVFVAPFRMEELDNSRAKNAEPDRLGAQAKMDELADHPPQVLSSMVVDQDGKLMVAYLSHRVKTPRGTEKEPVKTLLERAKVS